MRLKSDFELVGARSGSATMVNCLASDLRNPITAIQACVATLNVDSDTNMSDQERRALQIISLETEKLAELINKLLFCSDGCGVPPKEVDLRGLTERIVHKMRHVHPLGVKVQLSGTGPFYTSGHILQLERALENILVNAGEATPNNEEIRIELSSGSREGFHKIAIRDFGVGVPDYLKTKLFDSFASAKLDHLGMGLTIAHKIITSNGGTLEFNGRVKKGAEFIIELPISSCIEGSTEVA